MKITRHKNMIIYKHIFISHRNLLFKKSEGGHGLLPLLGFGWGGKSLVIYLLGQAVNINWKKDK